MHKINWAIRGAILLYPAFVIQDNAKSFGSKEAIPKETTLMGVRVGRCYYADVWDLDLYNEIAGFTAPVLIFHGTADGLVPMSYSQRAVEVYENAELVILDGQGHGFYGEITESVAEKITGFVQ